MPAAPSLLHEQSLPTFQPHPHFSVSPRASHLLEETIQRSLARRAARAVRPQIQGLSHPELWGVAFDESCLMLGSDQLVKGARGERLAAPLSVLGWARAKGARALVLVQNQPGARRPAELALLPTLRVAIVAALQDLILVDHIVIHGSGSGTHLRSHTILAEARALSLQFQANLEALSDSYRDASVPVTP